MNSHEEFEKKMIERFNNLNLKEGDLILAYDKGIHEVVKFEEMDLEEHPELAQYYNKEELTKLAPLIHYRKLYDAEFKPKKEKRIRTCSVFYVSRFDVSYNVLKNELIDKVDRLNSIYNNIRGD